jgi:hypothetical protein
VPVEAADATGFTLVAMSGIVAIDAVMVEPFAPNVTPEPLPNEMLGPSACVVPAEMERRPSCEAVTLELPLMPNVSPFESANTTVPVPTLCVPAEMPAPAPPAFTDAVTVCPFVPNVPPLLLLKTTVPLVNVVAPLTAMPPMPADGPAATLAVMTLPLAPNVTPLALLRKAMLLFSETFEYADVLS